MKIEFGPHCNLPALLRMAAYKTRNSRIAIQYQLAVSPTGATVHCIAQRKVEVTNTISTVWYYTAPVANVTGSHTSIVIPDAMLQAMARRQDLDHCSIEINAQTLTFCDGKNRARQTSSTASGWQHLGMPLQANSLSLRVRGLPNLGTILPSLFPALGQPVEGDEMTHFAFRIEGGKLSIQAGCDGSAGVASVDVNPPVESPCEFLIPGYELQPLIDAGQLSMYDLELRLGIDRITLCRPGVWEKTFIQHLPCAIQPVRVNDSGVIASFSFDRDALLQLLDRELDASEVRLMPMTRERLQVSVADAMLRGESQRELRIFRSGGRVNGPPFITTNEKLGSVLRSQSKGEVNAVLSADHTLRLQGDAGGIPTLLLSERQREVNAIEPILILPSASAFWGLLQRSCLKGFLVNFLSDLMANPQMREKLKHNPKMFQHLLEYHQLRDSKILLDTGAFVYFTNSALRDELFSCEQEFIDATIEFRLNNPGVFMASTCADVFAGSVRDNIDHFLYEKAAGIENLIYVIHLGEELGLVNEFLRRERPDWIGLGGSVMNTPKERVRYTEECYRMVKRVYGDTRNVKCHGFGIGSYGFGSPASEGLLYRYPFYSVDMTSWLQEMKNKKIASPFGVFSLVSDNPESILRSDKRALVEKFISSLSYVARTGEFIEFTLERIAPSFEMQMLYQLAYLQYVSDNLPWLGHQARADELIAPEELRKLPPYPYPQQIRHDPVHGLKVITPVMPEAYYGR